MSTFSKDINKTAICQKYNIVKKSKNKKNKNENFRKIRLKCNKKGLYKKNKTCIRYKTCEKSKQYKNYF